MKLRHLLMAPIALSALLLSGCRVAVLQPKGPVAAYELHLLIDAVLLMCIVVIPVIILTFFIARKYRASNTKARYTPNWSHNTALEIGWWLIPIAIIIVLATMTWRSTHKLDPYRTLAVKGKVLTIEAVSLRWRWLFIYPQQGIATINYLKFPVHQQVRFLVTSDAPMNSFMIEQLAGQIYSMNGMQTQLHLIADQKGKYLGRSVSFSGEGFANMRFNAFVTSKSDFNHWVSSVKNGGHQALSWSRYKGIAGPTFDTTPHLYSSVDDTLFKQILQLYMGPKARQVNTNLKPVSLW